MATAEDQIKQILEKQPDDNSYDEILRELAFKRMVDSGLSDYAQSKILSNEEMNKKIQSWQK